MLRTLDHVIVAVRDLGAATATYARLLGREPSWRGAHPGMGSANPHFRVANTYLELLAPVADGPTAAMLRARMEADGEGLIGMAFGTDDADECVRELRARGLSPTDPIRGVGRDQGTDAERVWKNVILPISDTRGPLVFAIEHLSKSDALPLVAPNVARESAFAALDHVVVRTGDAEATRAFYAEKLGLRLALERRFENRGVRLMFFRVGGVTVEVASRLESAPDAAAPDRLWGLAWQVPDADAARARLADLNVAVSVVRAGHKAGTRVFTIEGETHGVATLVIEPSGG